MGMHRRDDGFTLVELIVVVSLIALIAGVLLAAFATFVRTDDSVTDRITETRDLQNVTNFVPVDVASARVLTDSPSPGDECGSGSSIELHMEWAEDWNGAIFRNRVTYWLDAATTTLTRFECRNTEAPRELKLASSFESVNIVIEPDPVVPTNPSGTVTLELTYPDTVRRLSATSRNFLPGGP